MTDEEPLILDNCKWCGEELTPKNNHVTRLKFCNRKCRDKYWDDQRSKNVTRGEWAERRYGEVPDKDLSETEKVWLAAIIDGEGTIGIYRERRSKNKSGYRYKPTVAFSNTDKRLIDKFVDLTDCWVTRCRHKNSDTNTKESWTVEIQYRSLRNFLPKIKPYLIAKKEQANVVLDFLEELAGSPMRTSTNHDKFDEYYQRTRELNSNGPEPYSEYHDTNKENT